MTLNYKKAIIAMSLAAVSLTAVADDSPDLSYYLPKFHGAFRTRWELDTHSGDQRFQVRNARVSMEGNVLPSISYFFQTDLCDAGTMKILDAYGSISLTKGLNFRAGQFRMPFGVETFRAPSNYIFANRSFMGKQVMNYRAVGARLAYTLPSTPLTIEAGAFNPTAIGNHNVWNNTLAWSGKVSWTLPEGWNLATGYASIRPGDHRANLVDAALGWQNSNLLLQGEYMFEHYVGNVYKDVHSYVFFADWHKPVKCGMFNQWSLQGRFDGMTDHYSLSAAGDKHDGARNRITIGSTLTYTYSKMHADVRLNYEKYCQWKGEGPRPDRLVAELVIRF